MFHIYMCVVFARKVMKIIYTHTGLVHEKR
jgi:hypothetical protein